jgi:hypothetical protein
MHPIGESKKKTLTPSTRGRLLPEKGKAETKMEDKK